jgi:TfoX/Sxy family transcriptional regulator of competence genes
LSSFDILAESVATNQSTIDYILDQLESLRGISARKMFGEYALYSGPKVIALVCDDTLFMKMTEEGKAFVGKKYKEGSAYPGAKPSMVISGDLIEDREWICELASITAHHVPIPVKKKRASKKPTKKRAANS